MLPFPTTVPADATPDEPRLRALAPWQATLVCFGAVSVAIPLLVGPPAIADRLAPGAFVEPVVTGSIGAIGGIVLFLSFAWILGVPPAVFFLRFPGWQAIRWTGLTTGSVGVLLMLALAGAPDQAVITHVGLAGFAWRLLAAISIGLWTGIIEEFLIRGVLLSVIGHQWHWPGAILGTALIFGLLHQGGAETIVGTALYVGVTTVAGVLLGLVVVYTGNIWNAVAFHATWNALFAGYLIGLDVSAVANPIVTIPPNLPWLLSAGDGTLAESPLAFVLLLGLLGAYWRYALRQRPVTDP